MKIGYARVSTTDQNLDHQMDALQGAGCGQIFSDKISGGKWKRPGMADLLSHLRPGDQLVITKLDRLGRTTRQLLDFAAWLDEHKVSLLILDQAIDTSTPMGRFFFQLLAAFSEMERELIRERVNAGLAAARARGRKGGRRIKLDDQAVLEIRTLLAAGITTVKDAALQRGVSRATLYRALDRALD